MRQSCLVDESFLAYHDAYEGMTGQQRQRVLLQWLNQFVVVSLPAGSVEPVKVEPLRAT